MGLVCLITPSHLYKMLALNPVPAKKKPFSHGEGCNPVARRIQCSYLFMSVADLMEIQKVEHSSFGWFVWFQQSTNSSIGTDRLYSFVVDAIMIMLKQKCLYI